LRDLRRQSSCASFRLFNASRTASR
jgi:hypothetical protein